MQQSLHLAPNPIERPVEHKGDVEAMAIQWASWASLGKPAGSDISRPCAQHNQDGRLEVFAIGQGDIFNIAQLFPNAGWRDFWLNKSRPTADVSIRRHVVSRNADGRQEIFVVGDDNALWQKWQVMPNDGWSDWKTLGTPGNATALTDRFTVGRNQDGRQEVFAVGADGNTWQIWQTSPNGGWSNWRQLGRPAAGLRSLDRVTVANNLDGRQELFAMGGDDALWHVWQTSPNNGWGEWHSLDKPVDRHLTQPVVGENADGHLEVFAPGDGAFCNRWQVAPNSGVWRVEGWNEKPAPRVEPPRVGLTSLDVALNLEGRLEVIGFGDDGALWHAWQEAPAWSAWHSLGAPPATIRTTDDLTIGKNQDGRLEVFVMGQDGAVWHIWQVH